jgi:hypothetical protein
MYSMMFTVWLGVLVRDLVLSNSLSELGSIVSSLFEIEGWYLHGRVGEEWDLDIVVVVGLLVDGSWHLSVFGVGLTVKNGGLVVLGADVFLGVVLSALDKSLRLVWDGSGDLEWTSYGLSGWDLSVDSVLLVLDGGDWDVLLHLEGFLVQDGSWDLSGDSVGLGVEFSHSVVLGDGVGDLAGSLDLFLDPDVLWSLLVFCVLLSVVLSSWDLDLDGVWLVLVDNVLLLLVDLVWDLGGCGVWDLLGDGVWDLLLDGVVLGVVFDAVGDVGLSVWDNSWDLDLLFLGDASDGVLWNALVGPVLLFLIEAIIG